MKKFPKEDVEALKKLYKNRKAEMQEKRRIEESQKHNPFYINKKV